jgi:hypothetical protein
MILVRADRRGWDWNAQRSITTAGIVTGRFFGYAARLFEHFAIAACASPTFSPDAEPIERHDMESADGEGPSPALSPRLRKIMTKYGITRVPVDYFHSGDFRYTNLKDAIAQAKRQRPLNDASKRRRIDICGCVTNSGRCCF